VLIQDFLEAAAASAPDKVALVCDGRRFTYAVLDESANRLAHALAEQGVRRGDRVALVLGNSCEMVVGLFAALKSGAVFVAINPATKVDKLAYILDNCAAVAVIADRERLAVATAAADQSPAVRVRIIAEAPLSSTDCGGWVLLDRLVEAQANDRPARSTIDLDLACLVYTSGSTGDPMGVMTDHASAVFATLSIVAYLALQDDEVILDLLPLSFDYGLYQVFLAFRVGASLVLERSYAYAGTALQRIEEERVTGFPAVPTVFAMLLHASDCARDLSSVRYVTNTAAALPPEHLRGLCRAFPTARLYSMYGLTETKRTLFLPPDQIERRPASVGIPIPGTEAWIEDEDGHRLGPGAVGELVVRGRHVMRGYWGAPAATSRRFRPGPIPGERLCYTGDLFATDDEGYFYFIARKDDIIKSRGEKIAPVEVERVLYQLPGVVEAAVVGVADAVLGQAVKAFIVSQDQSLTARRVIAHCHERLEPMMVPKIVEFRTELPKTGSGKIRKVDLA
jgi:long-chain acyl-CoA synthetase